MGKREFYRSFVEPVEWGAVAIAIAFWINLLTNDAFPEAWNVLLVAPVVEEIVKYLGLKRTRSIVIPIIFLIGESVIQISGHLPFIKDVWVIWLYYVPFSIVMFKHLLYYTVMYVYDFKLIGLLLAIVAHSVWNWYSITEVDGDVVQLGLVTLMVLGFSLRAMYSSASWANRERSEE